MSARSAMIHRALVQRNVAASSSDGYEPAPLWQTLYEALPCHYWVRASPRLVSSQEMTGNIEAVIVDARLICPIVDINEEDRILRIKDRRGNTLVEGPIDIQGREEHLFGDKHQSLLLRKVH